MGKIILVGNQKGGVGKSTISVTLGCGLTNRGKKVLLVDADPQQSISKWRANAQGLPHEEKLPWVDQCATPLLYEKISKEKPQYDYIIIDSASNIGLKGDGTQKIIAAAFKAADLIIVPMGPSPFDVDGSEDFINAAKDAWDVYLRETPAVNIVINGVRPNTVLGAQVTEYVRESFGMPILDTHIQSREAYRQCLPQGQSIFDIGEKEAIKNANAFVDEVLAMVTDLPVRG